MDLHLCHPPSPAVDCAGKESTGRQSYVASLGNYSDRPIARMGRAYVHGRGGATELCELQYAASVPVRPSFRAFLIGAVLSSIPINRRSSARPRERRERTFPTGVRSASAAS